MSAPGPFHSCQASEIALSLSRLLHLVNTCCFYTFFAPASARLTLRRTHAIMLEMRAAHAIDQQTANRVFHCFCEMRLRVAKPERKHPVSIHGVKTQVSIHIRYRQQNVQMVKRYTRTHVGPQLPCWPTFLMLQRMHTTRKMEQPKGFHHSQNEQQTCVCNNATISAGCWTWNCLPVTRSYTRAFTHRHS